ncbi:hypothetical protein K7432_003616 [Basidiobolus ranarum]|uniref:C2H2-type domain-containing protein n=1 Tax=Basidiobolus ranarum TaxID=34480 RepID=A0ABR2WZP2_9FUNG
MRLPIKTMPDHFLHTNCTSPSFDNTLLISPMSCPFDSHSSHFESNMDFVNFCEDFEPLLFSGVNVSDFRDAQIPPYDGFAHLPTPSPQTPTKFMPDDIFSNHLVEPINRDFTHFWRESPLSSPPASTYSQESDSILYGNYEEKPIPFSMENPLVLDNMSSMGFIEPSREYYDARLSQNCNNSSSDSCVSPNDLGSLQITSCVKSTPVADSVLDAHTKSSSPIEHYNGNTQTVPESPKRSRGRKASTKQENQGCNKTFACEYKNCGKVFKRSEHLKRHVRSIHTLEKPFPCPHPTCTKRFSRSDNLNQHIRVHRNSRDRTANSNFNHFTPYVPSPGNQETYQSVFLN